MFIMFSWYKYLLVSLVFSHLGFWSGNLFLIAPFPDLCLLVPLYKFTTITVSHMIDLFDKLIFSILNYCSEVWGFIKANKVERVHLHFLKKLLGVKMNTQNYFVFGECNRKSLLVKRQYCIIPYWFKILQCNERKYVSHIYKMMLADLEVYPNKVNWVYLVKDLLSRLGFYHVW